MYERVKGVFGDCLVWSQDRPELFQPRDAKTDNVLLPKLLEENRMDGGHVGVRH